MIRLSTMIRLGDFLPPGEALTQKKVLTGLEAIRSVLVISCPQERRSPGWRQIRLGNFLPPRRGAHRAGGNKIRLGDFLPPGEAVTGLEAIRSVSAISCFQERRMIRARMEPSRGL